MLPLHLLRLAQVVIVDIFNIVVVSVVVIIIVVVAVVIVIIVVVVDPVAMSRHVRACHFDVRGWMSFGISFFCLHVEIESILKLDVT